MRERKAGETGALIFLMSASYLQFDYAVMDAPPTFGSSARCRPIDVLLLFERGGDFFARLAGPTADHKTRLA